MSDEVYSDVAMILSQCEGVYSADVPVAIQGLAREIVNAGVRDAFLDGSDEVFIALSFIVSSA